MHRLGRRFIMGIAALALAVPGLIGAGVGPALAAPSYNHGQLVNVHSGLCLVPKGDVIRAGTPIVQVTCGTDLMQQWIRTEVVENSNGTVTVKRDLFWQAPGTTGKAFHHVDGYCLGPANAANGAAATLQTTSCPTVVIVGNLLKDQVSGRCLDMGNNSTAQNAPAIWYTCHGTTNQDWWDAATG